MSQTAGPDRTLRILAVVDWDPRRVRSSWAESRLEFLRAAGADVEVLAVDCLHDRRRFVTLWSQLRSRLVAQDYDVVVPLYGSMTGLVCVLQVRTPVALAFAGSDLLGWQGPRDGVAPRAIIAAAASQLSAVLADGVATMSERMRGGLWAPWVRARARVIPDAVDISIFYPRARAEACAAVGVAPESRHIAFVTVSRASANKRLDLAKAVVARVGRELPEAVLHVISGVPFEQVPLHYAASDVLLVTSRFEGSPNCVKEALACGIGVVATDVGDVRDALTGLRNCHVVERPDPDLLAARVLEVLRDGRGCPDGPLRVQERYSPASVAARQLAFYADAITRSWRAGRV